ncbi:hypothetical protein [Buchananella hordeovulneris]|uniref:Uncharacterized protein n=1 Tax=Buchananella hordeovulneris TaxID=52770 RepID=A0A1Q5PYR7_9ACTO|nr:hypothetical protein [Buchananella hordeovulneris]MDO5080197.1 hypothetical protein [Buchananella hordeovulneris]OKL52773.1 hypothetical protein BSZ40_01320 [Buchananella hordeovulneris]RRD43870.1 hypothetical protein EII13_06250 [Buchananella hordeovulneris]RRD52211.1 hypothetical protein EII12_05565 [Buchananella hordeovulneris]
MSVSLKHFLLVYDRETDRLLEQREYQDATEAAEAYRAKEREFDGQPHMDIVLIGARDIETVWRLHSAYRDGAAARLRSPDVLEVLLEGFQV